LGEKEGDIINLDNSKVIGKHKGSWFHTIGQRKGLGLGQGPWFVVDKSLENNIVYVSHLDNYSAFSKDHFYLSQMNWINGEPDLNQVYRFKLRHGPEMVSGHISKKDGHYFVQLDQSDSGLAPGQHAVIYKGNHCLGGGMIRWNSST
jgi:tRNA-specific 2-thiouridylase